MGGGGQLRGQGGGGGRGGEGGPGGQRSKWWGEGVEAFGGVNGQGKTITGLKCKQ